MLVNGEQGGFVPQKRKLSEKEESKLKGKMGSNGSDAIYRKFCERESFLLVIFHFNNKKAGFYSFSSTYLKQKN